MPTPDSSPTSRAAGSRRRAQHSLDGVVHGAIALLDEAGPDALTFRALAARLGGGVGSIYWYVSSKDELVGRAADHVLGEVSAATTLRDDADPIDNIRTLAMAVYTAIAQRRWLGTHLMQDFGFQPHGMALYDRIGRQLQRLPLSTRQRFHAVSAVIGYVVGVSAELDNGPATLEEMPEDEREAFLARLRDTWRAVDPQTHPFLAEVTEEFEQHRDEELFAAGLDLLLAGLRLQASAAE
ncbi:TetR/AcrR family transcriptional regulator [Aeromicrobium massiliense]|uniref:TetR/AcrR family transcriptional regulator n=1 Tax=Aeromicrobium massiliense TaxID=1464554 RepID=UPI0002D75BDC|nr:TetR/AcrR family transcriptional regulator [Aeromicrobium massiliense]